MGSNMHFKGSFTFGQKIEGEEDWVEQTRGCGVVERRGDIDLGWVLVVDLGTKWILSILRGKLSSTWVDRRWGDGQEVKGPPQ